jgi:putative salt-induced outer membrane protein YdiY
MRSVSILLAIGLAALSPALFADHVTMKNGDRLTGKVVSVDDKTLVLQSDLAGVVKIPWESVQTIQSSAPLNLTLKDGNLLVGPLSGTSESFTVTTAQAGQVVTKKDAVQAIRSEDEQRRYLARLDRLQNPRVLDLWQGTFDAGYAATRGNAETNSFNLSAAVFRITPRDKLAVAFTSLNTTAVVNQRSVTTANAIRGGVKYNIELSKKAFAFGLTDLEFDEFQRLDLRWVIGGGGGYHVVKNQRSLFDVFTGASYNREFFSTGLRRSSGELLIGQEVAHQLNKAVRVTEKLVFYPNLSNRGNYRLNFDAGMVTAINRWLGWTVNLSDRYLSNPVPGAKSNDFIFTTGVRVTFAPSPIE